MPNGSQWHTWVTLAIIIPIFKARGGRHIQQVSLESFERYGPGRCAKVLAPLIASWGNMACLTAPRIHWFGLGADGNFLDNCIFVLTDCMAEVFTSTDKYVTSQMFGHTYACKCYSYSSSSYFFFHEHYSHCRFSGSKSKCFHFTGLLENPSRRLHHEAQHENAECV